MPPFKRKVISKCDKCKVVKGACEYTSNLINVQDNKDVLVITDVIESKKTYEYISKYLTSKGIASFNIVSAISCTPDKLEIPKPAYKTYKYCDALSSIDYSKYKTIITIGRAISSVTQNSDLQSWEEFEEILFNQTHFFKDGIRVYPLPSLFDWKQKDTFEKFYVNFQIDKIKEHLTDYKQDVFEKAYRIKVEDPNQFLLDNLEKPLVAWDLETNSLDQFIKDFYIKCMTISFDGITGYYLDFDKINHRVLTLFFSKKREYITANGKYDTLCLASYGMKDVDITEDVTLAFHLYNTDRVKNSIKSLAWLINFGGYDDALDEYKALHKIKDYTKIPESILFEYAVDDAIVTFRLYQIVMKYKEIQPLVYKNYKEVMIPAINHFKHIELRGMKVDKDELNALNKKLFLEGTRLRAEIDEMLKDVDVSQFEFFRHKGLTKVDINSSQQLAIALEEMGLPCYARSTKQFYKNKDGDDVGFYATGEPYLNLWAKEEYPIAKKIVEFRRTEKKITAFVGEVEEETNEPVNPFKRKNKDEKDFTNVGIVKHISDDGLIHPNYSPGRTDAWRATTQNPAVHNLPKEKEYRKIFKAPKDYVWVEVDVDGFHLRIVSHLSKDLEMQDVFINQGGDLHSATALNVFCRNEMVKDGDGSRSMVLDDFIKVKKQAPYKKYRQDSKGINFLFIYGGSAYGLAPTIKESWTEQEMKDYIKENKLVAHIDNYSNKEDLPITVASDIRKKFFEAYPVLEKNMDMLINLGKEQGYLDSEQGARRHLPRLLYIGKDDKKDKHRKKVIADLENICTNTPVLSFEAIYMFEKFNIINDELKKNTNIKAEIVYMVHDSIAGYVHKDSLKDFFHLAKNTLEDYTSYDVPMSAGVEYGGLKAKYGENVGEIENIMGFGEEITDIDEFIKELNSYE